MLASTILAPFRNLAGGLKTDEQWPVGGFQRRFLSYVLSFVYVGIYWNNHHHMLHACTAVTGAMLWANLHLLFWLSLFPFTTGWMGENHFTAVPTALYGVVLLMAAIAYLLLQQAIIRTQGQDSILKQAIGRDWKGKLSPVLYILAIVASRQCAATCAEVAQARRIRRAAA